MWGDKLSRRINLFVQVDTQVEQPEITAAIVEVNGGIELVLIGENISVIAFLVGNQSIERDVIRCFFCSENITSGIGRSGFQGKAVGRPDGGKTRFEGNAVSVFLVSTSAFTGESKPNHCDQQGTDERSAHQFPPFYGTWYKHYATNVVKKIGYFLTPYPKFY